MSNYQWLMAPHEYEPDYEAYWRDLESLEEAMANVATYDDWFPDLVSPQQSGKDEQFLPYAGADFF